MFDTVLVADRGLLACRVVLTCQRLGARAVTVHSAADAKRLHSTSADESLLLGESDPASTYLDGLKVIEAAGQAGAQAVHPGGSPLAASAAFATAVQDAGLTWVGPPPAALAAVGPAPAEDHLVTVLAPRAGAAVVVGDSVRAGARWSAPAGLPADLHAAAADAVGAAGLVGLVQVAVDPAAGRVTGLRPWLAPGDTTVELVAGLDLVEQSLLVAAGKDALPGDVRSDGAAVLVVLRARGDGRVDGLQLPDGEGLRVESGVRRGDDVDAGEVVLTVAAWGETDGQARERLAAARASLVVDGVELEEDPT